MYSLFIMQPSNLLFKHNLCVILIVILCNTNTVIDDVQKEKKGNKPLLALSSHRELTRHRNQDNHSSRCVLVICDVR